MQVSRLAWGSPPRAASASIKHLLSHKEPLRVRPEAALRGTRSSANAGQHVPCSIGTFQCPLEDGGAPVVDLTCGGAGGRAGQQAQGSPLPAAPTAPLAAARPAQPPTSSQVGASLLVFESLLEACLYY